MTDPIADYLTRIRNAILAGKRTVNIPFSRVKEELTKLLVQEGWVEKFLVNTDGQFKVIEIALRFTPQGKPMLNHLKRISNPGRRVYVKKDKIPVVLGNFGSAIISTPKGMMTNRAARKAGLGGEVICEIY